MISGAGGLAGGRLVDRLGTRPAFLLAGTVGAGAVALASYQHDLELFAPSYAAGCGVIAALGFYHVTQPLVSWTDSGLGVFAPGDGTTTTRNDVIESSAVKDFFRVIVIHPVTQTKLEPVAAGAALPA